jgi:hypothetical protein
MILDNKNYHHKIWAIVIYLNININEFSVVRAAIRNNNYFSQSPNQYL